MTLHLKLTGFARLPVLPLTAVLLGFTGCASQGPLQPPSLHLPARVQHLSAERFGDTVTLNWTTPTRTTDGVALETKHRGSGPLTAEICRETIPFPPGPCKPVAVIPVESGKPGSFHEVLTSGWAQGESRILRYRVRVLNAKGRGAEGADIDVAAGAAVPRIDGLHAAPAPGGGVTLRWQPGPSDHVMIRVVRDGADKPETLSVEQTAADPGGANDHAARAGVEQRYAVYRSRVVTINHVALTLNSDPVSTTVAANALPPAPTPPRGIEAVVNTLGKPEIDLVWQASDQPGVAGYLIYRSGDGAAFVQITPQPTRAFSFSDTDVQPGIHYRYCVVAVDANGAASQPSAEIERTIPAP